MFDKRIVFMGTPKFAATILNDLIDHGFNIVGVVTQKDKKIGRKQILTACETKKLALEYQIPVLTPTKIKKEYEEILALKPDLIITCAYGQIIPNALLDYPKYKCLNIHASLLPKYRGGAPIQRAIMNGEKETGITIMFMEEKMDAGDILLQEAIKIDIDDTNTTLFEKLSLLASKMILSFLPSYFNGEYKSIKQDLKEVTYAYNLNKEDEFISFNDKTINVYNHIRALLDNPGAYSILDDKKYKWLKVSFALTDDTDASIFKGLIEDYLRIDCLDGFIKIYELKPEGKNNMKAKDFYNGIGRKLVLKSFKESL